MYHIDIIFVQSVILISINHQVYSLLRNKSHSLNSFHVVGVISVGHISLPWSGGPGARFRMGVDGHFATIRTEISEIGWIFARRRRRSDPDRQAKEAFHVDDFRPCDLPAVVSQTAQRALVSGIYVWIIAHVWFLAQVAHVAVSLL